MNEIKRCIWGWQKERDYIWSLVRNSRLVFIASKYGSRILRSLGLEVVLEAHPLWKEIRVIFHTLMTINRGRKKNLTV